MSNEMTEAKSNLPASVQAMQGLSNSVIAVGAGIGGEQFMKMTKTGEFLFGAEDIEVEEGSTWAVNPTGFTHGWICWGTKEKGTVGKMLGEFMESASAPLTAEPAPIETGGPWTKQVGIQLRCFDGEDEGIQCLYKANSLGGKKAYTELVSAVVAAVNEGSEFIVPIISLLSDSYKHKSYGTTFYPVLEIVDWIDMEGLADVEVEEEPEPEPEPETRSRKKRGSKTSKAKTRVKAAEPEDGPEDEQEGKPVRRRRRRK